MTTIAFDGRRRELGAFLRSRRERITPDQVGLPPGGRRRTPGLRREEVAQLAGVGVTWYTWLEQGRDIHASEQVLDAIARTLLLDPHERSHLFVLAGAPRAEVAAECSAVGPTYRLLLERLEPYPAVVVNGRYDMLAFNRHWDGLAGGVERRPLEDRNLMWLAFTDSALRATLADWEEAVARMVAQFRSAMAHHVAEPAWRAQLKRLQAASPEFAELWQRHDVAPMENLTKRFHHPEHGLLRLHYTNLWLGRTLGTRMITYTPADDETAKLLPLLASPSTRSALPPASRPHSSSLQPRSSSSASRVG